MADEIIVETTSTEVVEVETDTPQVIEVGVPGPQGPTGATGATGPAGPTIAAENAPATNNILWEAKTTAFTAVSGGRYVASGTFTVTNPASGNDGELFQVVVASGTVTVNGVAYAASRWPVTVARVSGSWTTLANSLTENLTLNGTNSTAPNQTAASGASLMTRDLVDARSGRVLFYRVSSALAATSTAKVFDSTTLTIPSGTYEVQAHGRATYNGSNGGWSFGVERASGNSGTATALIYQHICESGTFNNTGGAYRASPTLNLFGGNAIMAAASTSGTSLHRTGQAAASGLLDVTSELVVVWYVAQVATDASNATTLDANSFLMLTKVA